MPRNDNRMNFLNPFTKILGSRLSDFDEARPEIDNFVRHWDRLESLVISVYKSGEVDVTARSEFDLVTAWLSEHFANYETALARHWSTQGTQVDGARDAADPFRSLFEHRQASSFVDDWGAMQTLPAAREALNRWLIELADSPAGTDDPG